MAWYSKIRSIFGQSPVHEAAGRGRRSLAWMPGNPGAVAAMLATNAELRIKSRDLVRRNAWAQAGIEAFVANAVGTGIKPQSLSPDDAAGAFVDKLRDPENEFDPNRDDLSVSEAERVGLTLVADYCTNVAPRYEFVAVEMETKPLDIDCGGGVTVRLTGTMDRARVRRHNDRVGIADLKSGSAAVQKGAAVTKGHGPQIGTYELLYEHTTGNPITDTAEIIGMKTKGKPEIATGEIGNGKRVMVGDENTPGLIEFAADMFRTGRFYPNTKSLLCSERYCPRWATCSFRDR